MRTATPEAPPAPPNTEQTTPDGQKRPVFEWQKRPLPVVPSEHVGIAGEEIPTAQTTIPPQSEEGMDPESPPPSKPTMEESLAVFHRLGFQIPKILPPPTNSAQPTTPDDMTTPDAQPSSSNDDPNAGQQQSGGGFRPNLPVTRSGKTPWYKRGIVKLFAGATILVLLICGTVWFFKSDDDVQLSEVVNNLADQKAGLENDKAGLLAKLGEAEAKASAVEELKTELAEVKKLAEKPSDPLAILTDPMVQAEIGKVVSSKLAESRASIVAEASKAAVNTLVFEEIPVTVNEVEGVMTLAFDEDGVGVIQFTPGTTAVAEAPAPEQ